MKVSSFKPTPKSGVKPSIQPNLKPGHRNILRAIAVMCIVTPAVGYAQQATDLGAVSATDGSGTTSQATSKPAAAKSAPSQGSLTARSAQSEVSDAFIRNNTSPIADFSQVIQMTPGVYSFSPNGPGLGDTKTSFRGFQDGDYSITFDGIPFQDTNSPTHHSWAFFPSQFIGGAIVDRSPGSAATIGPANFGGSINLLSRNLEPQQRTSVTGSYGTWNTSLIGLEHETGQIGSDGTSNLLINVHEMKSDGYQSFNKQKRDDISLKYQTALTDNTTLTLFGSYIDLHTNTPNTKGPTRQQVALFGDNYLLSANPAQANYYGYNFYHVTSDFEYIGLTSSLGNGWKLDDKLYTYAYHNQQNYNGTTITPTSGTDKLNGYRTYGNLLRLSQESGMGTFRTGLWSEYADTNRYQIPSDPRTWVDAVLPNFHEKFKTTTLQPFAEYEFNVTNDLKITPGIKFASYQQDFTQFADNGKTVGNLGGLPSITHSVTYSAYLPSFDVHYKLQPNWSVYGQYAVGNEIPPTNVFDVKNANVTALPAAIKSKTFQIGSVWKSDKFTFDIDAYHIKFDNAYSSFTDNAGNTTFFANGTSTTQGIEAESNIILGGGFSLYLNATYGSSKFANGQWVASAPSDTETVGLNYEYGAWNTGWFNKRIGKMYNDNGSTHQAVTINPFTISNLFINYTMKSPVKWAKQAKLQLAINNVFNKQNIVGVTPASTSSSAPAPGDVLTILPPRSTALTLTLDF
ncbi:TonB-dependent receptor domain-containing protein [Glaciimonas sp. PCH181]|uniref:TonB-dependent receptor domain-containing protein n=1 Tax=Glaciimonas sp. PCH181 TaxID=2133943 RepID=UPI000D3D0495|nr:TonB-dependent receptor [Glaciimonas sp. PCH181]PUA19914.1 TonB-dependent receptor [Glaciimonas sp. PCH181]